MVRCCKRTSACAALALLLVASTSARGAMILTAAGTSKGFVLTTFADQFPNSGQVGGTGPIGLAINSAGQVMVTSYNAGKIAVFNSDVDNQHYSAAALSSTNYGG